MPPDEEFYQRALDELVQKRVVSAIFAKAFALSDGDENRTRAAYIRIRVGQFAEEAALASKKKVEEAERLRAAEAARMRVEQEARERAAATERASRVKRLGDLLAIEARLRPTFGSKIHVVDKSRSFNADVPLAHLIAELHTFSSSAIYYDSEAHAFLSLDHFASKVADSVHPNG